MRTLIIVLLTLLLAAAIGVAIAQADSPVLWKYHCPRHHDVSIVPDSDGDGVHILCTRAALEEARRRP